MITITFHKIILAKAVTYEEEILDFILYNSALGNDVTSIEIILSSVL